MNTSSTKCRLEREFHLPNKQTFTIKPIAKLLKQEVNQPCIDPFPYPFERDALEYLRELPDDYASTVLFDPPYSPTQLKECYQNEGLAYTQEMKNNGYWSKLQREVSRIVKPGGKVIKFGWNTGRIYKGFEIVRILIVCHGSHHNDTLVTVQIKRSGGLFS